MSHPRSDRLESLSSRDYLRALGVNEGAELSLEKATYEPLDLDWDIGTSTACKIDGDSCSRMKEKRQENARGKSSEIGNSRKIPFLSIQSSQSSPMSLR